MLPKTHFNILTSLRRDSPPPIAPPSITHPNTTPSPLTGQQTYNQTSVENVAIIVPLVLILAFGACTALILRRTDCGTYDVEGVDAKQTELASGEEEKAAGEPDRRTQSRGVVLSSAVVLRWRVENEACERWKRPG